MDHSQGNDGRTLARIFDISYNGVTSQNEACNPKHRSPTIMQLQDTPLVFESHTFCIYGVLVRKGVLTIVDHHFVDCVFLPTASQFLDVW